MSAPAALDRLIFQTSRLTEFCSEKELTTQTGHGSDDWPLVILKELVDNALDACEEAEAAPELQIIVSDSGIAIADNGPGVAPETVASILDYHVRVSSREAYCSPTRGAQGNAMKTVLAMPFALDGERGETTIESRGVEHRIDFSIDPIRQEPRIAHVREDSLVKNGALIAVSWPDSACSILDNSQARFLQIAADYGWINPHLTLTVVWDRDGCDPVQLTIPSTDRVWRKWRPSDPTSPHWYDEARLGRLMAVYISHDEDHDLPGRTVRAFVSGFRGLSGIAKARIICEAVGAPRMSLAEFYAGSKDGVGGLLDEMRQQSRLIKPRDLGLIGEAHLRAKLESVGVAPESFCYKRAEVEHEGAPYLVEAAFGYCPSGTDVRPIITGINWFVSIGGDPFRRLGDLGQSLGAILTKQRAGPSEAIITVLHLACSRVEYLDRDKSSVRLPS